MQQVVKMISAATEIKNLDLDRIVKKVQKEKEWTEERVKNAERRYRNFLLMAVTLDNRKIVPTGDIDEIWHGHILDTQAYQEDCLRIAGHFIHHTPSFGADKEPDDDSLLQTCQEYKRLFGEEYLTDQKSGSCSSCCQGGVQPHCWPHACWRMCCRV